MEITSEVIFLIFGLVVLGTIIAIIIFTTFQGGTVAVLSLIVAFFTGG